VVVAGEHVAHFLAEPEAEMLGDEAAPTGLLASGSFLDAHDAVLVVDGEHHPGPATEEEATHVFDESVDEVLFERAQVLAVFGLHVVEHGAAEDGVELEEVLLAEDSFGFGAHAEKATGFEEVVFAQHVLDESLKLGLADAAKVRDVVKELPATLRADAAVFEGEGQELVDEHRPAALVLADALDPLLGGEQADRYGLHD